MVDISESLFQVPQSGGILQIESPTTLQIQEKIMISHDSYIYKFALPDNLTFGCPLGGHVKFIAEIDGKICKRSYTPISDVL